MHFGNFSLTVFLKKLKKEQFDCSYFCDSRYIYIYIWGTIGKQEGH